MSGRSRSLDDFVIIVKDVIVGDKWWLPVPCVPDAGLTDKARKDLQQRRDCANQIHKAAVAINSGVLSDMEVPESFMAVLPKVRNEGVHMSLLAEILG